VPAKDQIITLAILEKETPGITEFIKEKYNTTNPEQTWKSLGAFQRSNDKKNFEVAKRGFKKTGPKEGQMLGEFRKDKKAIKIIKDNYGKIKNDNIAKLAFPKLKFVTALRRTEQLIRQLKQDGEIKPMKTFQSLEAIEERPVGRPEFETIRKQTKTRLSRVKKVSDLYKEKQFQKAKKFSGTDLAHRLSLSLNFADDYNISQLGVERPEINRLLVAPTENKLIAIYKKQKKLIKEANEKGLTKDISKKLEAENLKVSDLVSKTDGRLQGIHIDEKTLKAKPVGMNYGFSIDFGLFDKPVKELTEAEVEFINKVTLPEAVKAEQKVDPKKVLKDFEERGLQITKEAKAKILGSFIDDVKSIKGGCQTVVRRALGATGGLFAETCEAVIKADPKAAAVKLNNAITATKGPLKDLKETSKDVAKLIDTGQVTTADKLPRPDDAIKRDMFKDANLRYNSELGAFENVKTQTVAPQSEIKQYAIDNPMEVKVGEPAKLPKPNKSVLKTVGKTLAAVGAPLPTALLDGYFIGKQVEEGKSTAEIASNPLNWLGLATMSPLTRAAGLADKSGRLSSVLRLGLNPGTISGISRFAGLPGLAISTAVTAYDQYNKYKNQEGFIYKLFNKEES